jgi:uncharacterized protein YdbL (DUF1318 family)
MIEYNMFTMTKKRITSDEEYEQAKREVNEARRQEMKRLYFEEGKSLEEIAKQFKKSVSMVSLIINDKR